MVVLSLLSVLFTSSGGGPSKVGEVEKYVTRRAKNDLGVQNVTVLYFFFGRREVLLSSSSQ